jgi:hypothetical protein
MFLRLARQFRILQGLLSSERLKEVLRLSSLIELLAPPAAAEVAKLVREVRGEFRNGT